MQEDDGAQVKTQNNHPNYPKNEQAIMNNSSSNLKISYILITILLIAVSVLATLLFTTSRELQRVTNEREELAMITPTITDIQQTDDESNIPGVNILNISHQCIATDSSVQLETKRAYLVQIVTGFPQTKSEEIARDYPDYYPGSFLVIEAAARNSAVEGHTITVYANEYFRLIRSSIDTKPIVYGGPTLGSVENGVVYAFFPVKDTEKKFDVTYCDLSDPINFTLDFTSSDIQKSRGVFDVEKGFLQSFD